MLHHPDLPMHILFVASLIKFRCSKPHKTCQHMPLNSCQHCPQCVSWTAMLFSLSTANPSSLAQSLTAGKGKAQAFSRSCSLTTAACTPMHLCMCMRTDGCAWACCRLYPRAFHDHHLQAHDQPEIQRIPLQGLCLQVLSLGLGGRCLMPAAHFSPVLSSPTPGVGDIVFLAKHAQTFLHLIVFMCTAQTCAESLKGPVMPSLPQPCAPIPIV